MAEFQSPRSEVREKRDVHLERHMDEERKTSLSSSGLLALGIWPLWKRVGRWEDNGVIAVACPIILLYFLKNNN